jgi:hypothetical protein
MSPLLIRSSRVKYVLLLIVVTCFTASGILILVTATKPSDKWIAGAVTCFFGAGIPLFIRQIADSRPRLTIDDHGIDDRTLGVGVIPWSEMTGAYVKSIRGNDFICLTVRDPRMWLHKLSPVKQAMVKANAALGFTELNINLSGVDADTMQIHELISKSIAANQSATPR